MDQGRAGAGGGKAQGRKGQKQGAHAPLPVFSLKKYKQTRKSQKAKDLAKILQLQKNMYHNYKPEEANFTRGAAGSGITGKVKYSTFIEPKPQESL